MLLTLSFRHTLELDVLRDRNPDYVTLADGAVRNAYTLKLMNRSPAARPLRLSVSGIKARQVRVIGDGEITSSVLLPVEADLHALAKALLDRETLTAEQARTLASEVLGLLERIAVEWRSRAESSVWGRNKRSPSST